MEENKYYYSEIFRSLQGEGTYTGVNSLWIRWFMCNLQCDGFGQKDPTDPSSYILPYKDLDLINIQQVEDLPVFDYGCDSSYTWSKKYKHLMKCEDIKTIADKLEKELVSKSNPQGKFLHPVSLQETHMCFTGGEPLLKANQKATVATMNEFRKRNNLPRYVTVETNGTQKLIPELVKMIKEFQNTFMDLGKEAEWFWSVSPKLYTVSGEKPSKAIKPEHVAEYVKVSNCGHLKFVANDTDACWEEIGQVVKQFKAAGINWPVFIMPVGATKEQQEMPVNVNIVHKALERGYNISGRLHCHLLGNSIGT